MHASCILSIQGREPSCVWLLSYLELYKCAATSGLEDSAGLCSKCLYPLSISPVQTMPISWSPCFLLQVGTAFAPACPLLRALMPPTDSAMWIRQAGWAVAITTLYLSHVDILCLISDHVACVVSITVWCHRYGHSSCRFTFTFPSPFLHLYLSPMGLNEDGGICAYLQTLHGRFCMRSRGDGLLILLFTAGLSLGAIWDEGPRILLRNEDPLSGSYLRQDFKNIHVGPVGHSLSHIPYIKGAFAFLETLFYYSVKASSKLRTFFFFLL